MGEILWQAPRKALTPSTMKLDGGTCQEHATCVVLTASIFLFLQELLFFKKSILEFFLFSLIFNYHAK